MLTMHSTADKFAGDIDMQPIADALFSVNKRTSLSHARHLFFSYKASETDCITSHCLWHCRIESPTVNIVQRESTALFSLRSGYNGVLIFCCASVNVCVERGGRVSPHCSTFVCVNFASLLKQTLTHTIVTPKHIIKVM